MKRVYVGVVLSGLALSYGACKGDPTSSLRGGPASLSLTPRTIFMDTGTTKALLVTARDAQLNPVPVVVSVTSANATVAKVVTDTSRPFIDSSTYAYQVTGGNPGQTKLNVTGGGLTDQVTVSVLPLAFPGALSSTSPKGGDTLTIHSTSLFTFDPDSVHVIFGADTAILVRATTDTVRILVPYGASGKPTITGILMSFIPGFHGTLPTAQAVNQVGDYWAGDSSWQTSPDITGALPGPGKSSIILSAVGPSNAPVCPEGSPGPCMMFHFTLAAPTTLKFSTNWIGTPLAPDVDIYLCSDSTVANFGTACFEDGGAGATANQPQTTTNHTYPAGTHYFVIENFDGTPSKTYVTTISQP